MLKRVWRKASRVSCPELRVQNFVIMSRSEEDDIKQNIKPSIPDTYRLPVSGGTNLELGKRGSLVVMSKAVSVSLDSRKRGPVAKLEPGSHELLREMWLAYNEIASLDRHNLAGYDYGKFPWYSALDRTRVDTAPAPQDAAEQCPRWKNMADTTTPAREQDANSRKHKDPPVSELQVEPAIESEAESDPLEMRKRITQRSQEQREDFIRERDRIQREIDHLDSLLEEDAIKIADMEYEKPLALGRKRQKLDNECEDTRI